MNSETAKNTETNMKKRITLLVLKIVGIVLGCLLVISLVVGGIFYLVFSIMYNNGIYDASVETVPAEHEFFLPDWDELDPVLVSIKVTKDTTEYNVREVNSPKEEYTGDITVKGVYLINGKLEEKEPDNYYISVEKNMLSTTGDKKISVKVSEGYGAALPYAYKTVYIPIKVVDDGSAKEDSPFDTTIDAYTYRGNGGYDQWSSMYPDEYELIKNLNSAPIVELPQKDSDIINILILGTAKNDNEPELERQMLQTVMVASYNANTKEINLISVHNQLLGVMDQKVYPLSGVYAIGGAGAAVNSVNAVLGTDIQHYVEIDLDSFVTFINKMGGVSISLTQEEIDALALEDVAPGEAILTGENAEKYLSDNGNDETGIEKTDRQRKFLIGLFKKLLSMQAFKAFEVVATDTKFVKTNLPFSVLAKYVLRTGFDISELSFERHFSPYGDYGKDYAFVVYEEKYRMYYSNPNFLKEETEKILGYHEGE
ncbi:MAG: LytR family transcriptional regulator [Ruminococcaceae bacterium]|nr:LytR family transcriptional regulator [Oscillospiraceae bacterium]